MYLLIFNLQGCFCELGLEYDDDDLDLDLVYFFDRSFPPHLLVLCNFHGHLRQCIEVCIF